MLEVNKITNSLILANFDISKVASLSICPFYYFFLPFDGAHIFRPFFYSSENIILIIWGIFYTFHEDVLYFQSPKCWL